MSRGKFENHEQVIEFLKRGDFFTTKEKHFVVLESIHENVGYYVQRCPRTCGRGGADWASREEDKDAVHFHDYMVDMFEKESDSVYRNRMSYNSIEQALTQLIEEEHYPLKYVKEYKTWDVWDYR